MEQPDTEEKCIRFGCGGLLGAVLGGLLILRAGGFAWPTWALVIAAAVVVCGWLAVIFGDDFWFWISGSGRW